MLEEKEHLLNNSLFDSSFAQGDQTKSRAAQTADLEETQRPKKIHFLPVTKQLQHEGRQKAQTVCARVRRLLHAEASACMCSAFPMTHAVSLYDTEAPPSRP